MKEFINSEEHAAIMNDCKLAGIWEKEAAFASYSDNVFTYEYEDSDYLHEFSFIADDSLLEKLEVCELMHLRNVKYFQYRAFEIHGEKLLAKSGYKTYTDPPSTYPQLVDGIVTISKGDLIDTLIEYVNDCIGTDGENVTIDVSAEKFINELFEYIAKHQNNDTIQY
jgi:hypothetical protein